MDDSSHHGDQKTPKYAAPKDKQCPYCGQAFTSSSLGRHLDLYIREKNPKPPDGLHDVDEIKKLRGGITRRQARTSIGGRREISTPRGTSRASSRRASLARGRQSSSGSLPKDGQYAVDSTLGKYPFPPPRWESTGVMNDIGESTHENGKRPGISRTVSRQAAQKAQYESNSKLADTMDTARAAELALRELLSSWRAAKQQFDANSMPFDFDPLSLDFPALTLQCLKPPPTLFSSTQHPTSTSWSIQPPGQRQFTALQKYFEESFRKWKVACATATIDAADEFSYTVDGSPRDKRDMVKKAEESADNLEKQVNEHMHSAYAVWDKLPAPRQNELWVLELARSVGRKDKEIDARKESQEKLEQEVANLKSNVDQLNRLQQPKEFKIVTPTTFPFEREFINHAYELGSKGASITGFNLGDREADLTTIVTRAIERWKTVIVSSRITEGGMGAQKSLDQPKDQDSVQETASPRSRAQSQTPQQQLQPHESSNRLSSASTNGVISEQTAASSAATTAPPSVDDSDQDADADMEDDDSFAMMDQSPSKHVIAAPMQQQQQQLHHQQHQHQHQQRQHQPLHQPQQQQHQHQQARLAVPRTRAPVQQQQQQHQPQPNQQPQQPMPDQRYMMQNPANSPVGRTALHMGRSMPNLSMTMQNNGLHAADLSMGMHGMHGEQMYLE